MLSTATERGGSLCLGYSEETLLDRRLEDIMAADQWRLLSELSRDMLTGKPGYKQLTLECRHKAGKAVRGLLNLAVVADQTGAARHLSVQIQDISNLIRTESELEESRQRYRGLADATFEAVFISKKGICIDTNRAASVMFDTPRKALIGIFGTDIIAPDYQSRVRENMLSVAVWPPSDAS